MKHTLRIIDLDSNRFFGVGRDMTDNERLEAEKHGRFDNPPMSILGITRDGLAAVDGKEQAEFIVRACNSHYDLIHSLAFYMAVCGNTCHSVTRESAQEAHRMATAAIAKATEGAP